MNNTYGFRLECMEKYGSTEGNVVWKRINEVFNWLPLAAIIDRKVLCMHGGIGPNVTSLQQIEQIQRPLRAYFHDTEDYMPSVNEILWSDPAEDDSIVGYQHSERGPKLFKFGADRVNEFCNMNGLELIIRSHQCVMDGFERFAGGRLVTVFSATNYCGHARNNGAIIQLGRKLEVIVRTIQPKADDEGFWDAITNEQNPPSPMNSPRRAAAEEGGDESSDEEDEEDMEELEDESDDEEDMSDHEEYYRDGGMLPRSTHAQMHSHMQSAIPRVAARPLPPLGLALSQQRRPSDGGNAPGLTQQIGRFQIGEEPLPSNLANLSNLSSSPASSLNGSEPSLVSPNRRKLPPVRATP